MGISRFTFLLCFLLFASTGQTQVRFTDVTLPSGITTPTTSSTSFTNSWADFDNDDYWDLFVARGDLYNFQVPQVYHNLRNGKFEEITSSAFLNLSPGYYAHMCFGDFDNDGYVDCFMDAFVSSVNKLWKNNRDLTFTDVSSKMSNPGGETVGTIWTDYDKDGFVDLIVSAQSGQGTKTYHNNQGNTLDLVTLFDNSNIGDIVLATDINQDGWPDYYIHNDFVADLFLSDQQGIFQPFDNSFDVKDFGVHARITAAFADIDNDGFPEFMLGYDGKLVVWHNDGGTGFHNWTSELHLEDAAIGDHRMSFIQDVDNDGYLDIILFNLVDSSEIWYGGPDGFLRSTAPFHSNVTTGPSSLSWTDYDNDGFIDFFEASYGTTALWHNKGNSNRWLNVKLRGHQANSMGLGSTVVAYSEGKKQYREVGYYQSYYGYQPAMAHFGFGSPGCNSGAEVIDSVVVIWQPGGRQVIKDVRFNELAVIDQDSGIVRTIQKPLSVSYGFAYPYFLASKSVFADTLVSMPLAVHLPNTFVADSLLSDEITFAIGYNSDVIDISATKVAARYTPPAGWILKSSVMKKDTLVLTISNAMGVHLPDSVGLGTLKFDTYTVKATATYLFLDQITVRAKGTDYSFCHNYEGDFLGAVVIVDRNGAGVSEDHHHVATMTIAPNPASGKSVNVRYTSDGIGEDQPYQVSVSDVLGNTVWQSTIAPRTEQTTSSGLPTNFAIPTSALSRGTYLVRLSDGGKLATGKFTVVR
ncbi:MAG: FG-GAP-like repeat-containing protein [Bacteroidota bacterium]|nr:FG-GAP-like repeat-containing protein [Bacteroidota bacterium]